MENTSSDEECAEGLADVREGTPNPVLDYLLDEWPRLAAVAWEGYLVRGRGAVVVRGEVHAPPTYRPGPPCPCHAELVQHYEPREQTIVVLRIGGRESIHLLGGWPSPVAAWEAARAVTFAASVH